MYKLITLIGFFFFIFVGKSSLFSGRYDDRDFPQGAVSIKIISHRHELPLEGEKLPLKIGLETNRS